MDRIWKIIGQWIDGNVNVTLVEWTHEERVDFEILLAVNGDSLSMSVLDVPRVCGVLRDGFVHAERRVNEFAEEELTTA